MKLQDITTWVTVPPTGIGGSFWVIVKVTTDDGIDGVGECYGIPFSGDIACRMVEDTFERYIAGQDPHDVETLFRRVYSAGFTQRPDVLMMGVFSGIEIAIWDILGKASGQPVYRLIGGKFHDRIRTYTYLYPRSVAPDGGPEEDPGDVYHDGDAAAERALEYVEMGFTALKQDPAGPYSFQGGRELSLHELARSEYSVRRIREAVGDRADILETIRSGFHDSILRKRLRWEQGYLIAPDEPGLGIELDESVVREHPCTTGGRLHLEMCRTPLGSNNTKTITELDG